MDNLGFPNSWFYCYTELQAPYAVNITNVDHSILEPYNDVIEHLKSGVIKYMNTFPTSVNLNEL